MNIVYIDKNGKRLEVRGKVGDNVMYLAHRYNIELEGMVCLFDLFFYVPSTIFQL